MRAALPSFDFSANCIWMPRWKALSSSSRSSGPPPNKVLTQGIGPIFLAFGITVLWLASILRSDAGTTTIVAWGYTNDTSGSYAGVTSPPVSLTNVSSISAGGDHSLALGEDGTVAGWGENRYGQAIAPPDLTNVVAVAAGFYHSLILKSDGTVVAWGSSVSGETNVPTGLSNVVAIAANGCDCSPNGNKSLALKADGSVVGWGATTVPPGLRNVVALSAGGNHALALTREGIIVGWGNDGNGQSTPPTGLSNVVAIAAGGSHSMALRRDGTVVAWGNNFSGQTNTPAGLSNVVAIAAGERFCLALRDDGNVAAWGDNWGGQTTVPMGLTNVVAISGGWQHSLALINDGSPAIVRQPLSQTLFVGETAVLNVGAVGAPPLSFQWQFNGSNLTGETNTTLTLTNGQSTNSGTYTLIVSNAFGVTTQATANLSLVASSPIISVQPANVYSAFGRTASFSVAAVGPMPMTYQWRNGETMIPNETRSTLTLSNLTFADAGVYSVVISNSVGVTVSSNATLVIPPLVSWGAGAVNSNASPNYGQSIIPAGASNVAAMSAGGYHNLGLKPNGRVIAWGWNGSGQTNVPLTLTNATAIAAGLRHSLALKSNGNVTAWGDSNFGQGSAPFFPTNVMAIAAGWYHNLALKSNGTVVAWGAGTFQSSAPFFGQSMVPTNLSGVTAIAAGGYHSLALKGDGLVTAWGWNASGQTNVPASLTNVVAIAAGASNSLALKNDGTLVAWGDNTYGQTNIPVGLSNVVAIASGAAHTMALQNDGTLMVWGLNGNNQTNVPSGLTNTVAISAGAFHNLALVTLGPVAILNQPQSQTIFKGSSATFDIGVLGAQPLSYQWQFNGADLPSATNRLLVVSNAQLTDSGNYRLLVTNAYGGVTSSVAVLTVNDAAPFFTLQPVNQFVLVNSNVSFAVNAGGLPPLSYQWQFNGMNLEGKTNRTLLITNAQFTSEGDYTVVVSNSVAVTVSSNAFLNVIDLAEALDATNLVWIPTENPPWVPEMSVTHDGIAAVSSGPLAYPQQSWLYTKVVGPGTLNFWWMSSNTFYSSSDFSFSINGSTKAILNGNGWQQKTIYFSAGTNFLTWMFDRRDPTCCTRLFLDQVSYIAGTTPALIVTPLSDRNVTAGTNVTFAVVGGGTPPLSYQWQFAGTNIEGATNPSLALTNVQTGNSGSYSVVVSNDYGVANASATLTVNPSPPYILVQPASQEMVRGGTVAFTVSARGSDPLSYRWQFNDTDIPGAITSSLTLSLVQSNNMGNYRVRVSNTYGTLMSPNATLSIVPTVIVGWGSVYTSSPNPPLGLTNVTAISAGDYFSLALRSDGTVFPWGWDAFSRLNIPAGLTNVTAISAGGFHGSALRSDGGVVNWGDSFFDPAVIVPAGLSNVVDVAAGDRFNFGLKRDGSLTAWGDNSRGQLNFPSGLSNIVDVTAGPDHALALRSDKTVVAWGSSSGITNVPSDLSNVVAIAGGYGYSMALKADGSVVVWDIGSSGLTNIPSGLDQVVSIAGGARHGLALKRDGTVIAWGGNSSGQTDVPSWLTNVVAVAGGYTHSLALLNDGSPFITRQPWTLTRSSGMTAEFHVVALGLAPLSYQWQINGTNINGATSALLTLTNIPLGAAGSYRCIVSNAIGSATTLPATLIVLRSTPQFVQGLSGFDSNGNFDLYLTGLSGHGDIVIYGSTNLVGWQPILTNPPALGSLLITDPTAKKSPQRFYRMEER